MVENNINNRIIELKSRLSYIKNNISKIDNNDLKDNELNISWNLKPEVILLIYQRPHHLKNILKAFSNQTYKNFKLTIINNNKHANNKIDNIIKEFPKLEINLKHNNKNLGIQIRYKFAKDSKRNPLIFLDDDMVPNPDFVEYMIAIQRKYGKKYLLGWHSKKFSEENYWTSQKISDGEEVDYVGCGSMVMDKSVIDTIKEMQNIPSSIDRMDDLWMSYWSKKYGYKLINIKKKVKQIKDGKDSCLKIRDEKNDLFKKLIKKGWKLLKERKNIKFHILVTGYNFENYIKECLDSIMDQSYRNFECIIIDDGSEDKTYEIAKNLIKNDSRFKIYKNDKNYGAAYSRYKGFKQFNAKDNEICMYVDGDDYLMNPNVLNRILEEYQDDNCWFTYGSHEGPFSNILKPIPREVKTSNDFRKTEWVYGAPRTYRYFLLKKLTKEDFLGPDGNFLPTCTDFGFLLSLLEMAGKERVRFIPDILYYYREHLKNSWKTMNKEGYKKYILSKKPYQMLSPTIGS